MRNEQAPAASSASTPAPSSSSSIATTTTVTTTSSSTGRNILPCISIYSGITDRQTVRVLQQALSSQPGTAAQYLHQMYVAQQQHLMLQTAALHQQQRQQLNSAQLQSLATIQQGSIVAGRPTATQNVTAAQQTGNNTQTTINLTTPTTVAQLISRVHSVSSAPTCVPQPAMILGNGSGPVLTASQAQMYLRAQMLIFTPTAAVTAVQSEALTQSATNQKSASAQVQNLSVCSQQGDPSSSSASTTSSTSTTSLSTTVQLQTSGGAQLSLPAAQLRSLDTGQGQRGQPGQGKESWSKTQEATSEGQKSEARVELSCVVSVSHSRTAIASQPLLSPAYAQIQTHQLFQQHKQQSLVIQQQQQHLPQRSQAAAPHTPTPTQTLAIQPQPQPQTRQGPVPVLPKPATTTQPATIFHSTVSPQVLVHSRPSPAQNLNRPSPGQTQTHAQPSAKPPQPVTVHHQSQATAASSDRNDKMPPTSGVVAETSTIPVVRKRTPLPTQEANTPKPRPSNSTKPPCHTEGEGAAEGLNVKRPSAGSAPVMTSGNGNNAPTVTGSTPQNGESKPPQAIVKPQILTHLIEGFVIQEGAEPFPVERPSFSIESIRRHKQRHSADSEMEDLSLQALKAQQDEPMLTCELCGRVDFAYIFKRSKRFCSTLCAKRYNVGCTKRMGLFPNRKITMENLKKRKEWKNGNYKNSTLESKKKTPAQKPTAGSVSSDHSAHPAQGDGSQCSDMSSYEGPPSPLSAASSGVPRDHVARDSERSDLSLLSQSFLPSDPAKWNVEDVYEFICSLPGCLEIAEEFRSQEIDGQALLLLKEDHLMGTMNIKLGPALKIFAQISMLKDS